MHSHQNHRTKTQKPNNAQSWIRLGKTRIALNILAVAWGLFLIGTHQIGDAQPQREETWKVLKECQLAPNVSNDGDSFHVVTKEGQEHVFRLYMLDTAETSYEFPERVAAQAKDFDTTEAKTVTGGLVASVVTKKLLGAGNFTVKTQGEDARGRSAGGRTYAVVELSNGEDLGSILLKLGLARSYGKVAPEATGKQRRLDIPEPEDYEKLQARAKSSKVGIWGKGDIDLPGEAGSLLSPEEISAIEEQAQKGEPKIRIKAAKAGIKLPPLTVVNEGTKSSKLGEGAPSPNPMAPVQTVAAPAPSLGQYPPRTTAKVGGPKPSTNAATTNAARTISTPYGTMSITSPAYP